MGRNTLEILIEYQQHKEFLTKILQQFLSAKLDVYAT